jgi:WD40 repeat protein
LVADDDLTRVLSSVSVLVILAERGPETMRNVVWRTFGIIGLTTALMSGRAQWSPNRVYGAEEPERRDQYGDPLPKDALVRLGTIRFRVEGYISSIAFSPDGKLLAAGDSEGLVYLWESATGKLIRRLDASEPRPRVLFSPDGNWLVARNTTGQVSIWETATGKLLSSFQRNETSWRESEILLFTPTNDQLLAVPEVNASIAIRNGKHQDSYVVGKHPEDFSIKVLELLTGKTMKHLAKSGPQTIFSDATLAPDGKLLAIALRAYKAPCKHLQLIEVATGKLVREIRDDGEGWFLSVAFAPDGKTLALGSRDEIVFADVETGKLVGRLTAKMGTVAFLAFTHDGKTLISHGHDNKVRSWDVAGRKQQLAFDAEADGFRELPLATGLRARQTDECYWKACRTALSPDGKTLAVGISCCIHLWDVVTGKKLLTEFAEPDGWARALGFSPNGRLVLVNGAEKTRLWDPVKGDVVMELPPELGAAVFSPDGRRLAFVPGWNATHPDAHTAFIWDIDSGKELQRLPHPAENRFHFATLAFAPDGQTLLTVTVHQSNAGYEDNTVLHRWDVATGKALGSVHRRDTRPWHPSIAPDGRTVAIELREGGRLLVDAETGRDIRTIRDAAPTWFPGSPAFSPDSRLLFLWTTGGSVSLWEVATGSLIFQSLLRVQGNLLVEEWPRRGDKMPGLADLGQSAIESLVISPDGRLAASSERYDDWHSFRKAKPKPTPTPAIRVWEVATGKEVQRLEGYRSRSTSLAFSPDGSRLASWLHNGTVLIWDTSRTARPVPATEKRYTAEELNQLWAELAAPDAATAYCAVAILEAAPTQAIDLFARQLQPVPAQELEELLKALDSDQFTEREQATEQLKERTGRYESVLRRALQEKRSVEAQRRLEEVLSVVPPRFPPETLRTLRSIATLERIGSTEARQMLQALAKGAADARETLEVRATLERLAR